MAFSPATFMYHPSTFLSPRLFLTLSYYISTFFPPPSAFWDIQSKIVRVLNLWQKNAVFKSDIIQPLLDMAAGIPPPSATPVLPSSAAPVNNTTPGQ